MGLEEEERRPPQPHGGRQKVREWRNGRGRRKKKKRRRRKDPPTTVLYCKICSYCVCLAADWREGTFSPAFSLQPPSDLRRGCTPRSTPARDTGNRPADVDRSHRQRKESQPHWPPSAADDRRHVIVVVMSGGLLHPPCQKRRRDLPGFPHITSYMVSSSSLGMPH